MTTEQQGFNSWAIVELFGHQRIAGSVTEQVIAGGTLLRVDVPRAGGDGIEFTRFFGVGAIYALTPVEESIARRAAAALRVEPVTVYIPSERQLPAASTEDDRDTFFDNGDLPDDDPENYDDEE